MSSEDWWVSFIEKMNFWAGIEKGCEFICGRFLDPDTVELRLHDFGDEWEPRTLVLYHCPSQFLGHEMVEIREEPPLWVNAVPSAVVTLLLENI